MTDTPFQAVVAHAAKIWSLTPEEVLSRSRLSEVVMARHVVMYVAALTLQYSQVHIGRLLDRDHTSVCGGVEKIRYLMKRDKSLAARVNAVSATALEVVNEKSDRPLGLRGDPSPDALGKILRLRARREARLLDRERGRNAEVERAG